MSQKAVYELLQELGGRATVKEIRALALKRYPDFTLYHYVSNRLQKLQRSGYVRHKRDGTWEIAKKEGPKA